MTGERDGRDIGSSFTCFACKGEFKRGVSEADAKAEFERLFPGHLFDSTPKDEVCDDCFKLIMADEDDAPTNDLREKVAVALAIAALPPAVAAVPSSSTPTTPTENHDADD